MTYDGLQISLPSNIAQSTIPITAPATLRIETLEPMKVLCAAGKRGCGVEVECLVDGKVIGRIQKRRSVTMAVPLLPGPHTLELRVQGAGSAKAVWAFGR